jgi:hypothetical protein
LWTSYNGVDKENNRRVTFQPCHQDSSCYPNDYERCPALIKITLPLYVMRHPPF